MGMDAGWRTIIDLGSAADAVEITLSTYARAPKLVALDANNQTIDSAIMSRPRRTMETIRFEARAERKIQSVRVEAPQNETAIHRICRIDRPPHLLVATARDQHGRRIGRYEPQNSLIEIPGRELSEVELNANGGPFCIRRICWVEGLTAAEQNNRMEMLRHIASETARWHDEGFVLAPFTQYRLKITTTVEIKDFEYNPAFNSTRTITQCAYFRTEGPPGLVDLSIPKNHPAAGAAAPAGEQDPPKFDSGLGDLTRYVRQTIPLTVPSAGRETVGIHGTSLSMTRTTSDPESRVRSVSAADVP